MKLFIKKIIIFSLFLVTHIPLLSYATNWPIFSSPDKKFLLSNNYIDTAHCPYGQGKLVPTVSINIHDSLCSTYCPISWVWVGNSDGICHDLTTSFEMKGYEIAHYDDNEGTIYSVITAFYGEKNSDKSFFTFTFTTPEERWYCIEMNPEYHTLTCANDM